MKFIVKQKSLFGGRLGQLSDWARLPDMVVETPSCLLYTRYGFVPYLTPDVVEKMERVPLIVNHSINYLTDMLDVLEKYKKGIGSFCRMEDRITLITQTDTTETYPIYSMDKDTVSVWGKSGRRRLNVREYSFTVRVCHPDGYQSPVDNETPEGLAGRKRCQKAVDRTQKHLDDINMARCNEFFSTIPMWMSVGGGLDMRERERGIAGLLRSEPAVGYVLDGFRSKTDTCLSMDFAPLSTAVTETCRLLPEDRPRLLPAIGQPADVVNAVRAGVDLFDGTFPYLLTRQRIAWIHPPVLTNQSGDRPDDDWLNLKDTSLLEDFSPLQKDCSCMACRQHTRAYLCHLVVTKEMLADILLMIHNSHQYYLFFEELRTSLRQDRFEEFHRRASTIRYRVPTEVQ